MSASGPHSRGSIQRSHWRFVAQRSHLGLSWRATDSLRFIDARRGVTAATECVAVRFAQLVDIDRHRVPRVRPRTKLPPAYLCEHRNVRRSITFPSAMASIRKSDSGKRNSMLSVLFHRTVLSQSTVHCKRHRFSPDGIGPGIANGIIAATTSESVGPQNTPQRPQ